MSITILQSSEVGPPSDTFTATVVYLNFEKMHIPSLRNCYEAWGKDAENISHLRNFQLSTRRKLDLDSYVVLHNVDW